MSIESDMAKIAAEVEAWVENRLPGYEFWVVGYESWYESASGNSHWRISVYNGKCIGGNGKTIEGAKLDLLDEIAAVERIDSMEGGAV